MFTDDITIKVSAGDGGKGAVAFNKNMMMLGPAGGSGGTGGPPYAEGVGDFGALRQFRFKKEFQAEHGQIGRGQFRDGHDGANMTLAVPVGTIVHNLTNNTDIELTKIGESVLLAKGGHGGKGNFLFRSPKNT